MRNNNHACIIFILLALFLSDSASHGFSLQQHSRATASSKLQISSTIRGGDQASSDNNNDDKLVLVTGGARGIGKATCLLLASRGYQVAVNYRSNKAAAQKVVDEIQQQTCPATKVMAFQADVSQEKQVEKLLMSSNTLE